MDEILNTKLVAENEKCKFFINSFTVEAEKWAQKYGMKDIKCLLAVQKDNKNDKSYVLIRNEEFIYDTTSYEALGCYIDAFAVSEGRKRI
jgi:hypothetical protein